MNFPCSNWREGLENVEDGWDYYKVELIPEANKMIFIN